jgi:hypothetical protein
MDPSTDADISGMVGAGPETGAVAAAAVRTASWWLLSGGLLFLGAKLRHNNAAAARSGWALWRLLLAVVVSMAVNASVYSGELAAFAGTKDAYAGAVPALHRLHIFTSNWADAAFIAVLMLLASGYCVTRAAVPQQRRAYVFGVPVVLFLSGIVTDYGFYELSGADDEDDFKSMGRWDAAFWFGCTLVNLAALLIAWVGIFECLESEAEALRAQELANVPAERERADAATSASHAHAALPDYVDQSQLPPGVVAFKPLRASGGGGGGADGEDGGGRGRNGGNAANDEEAQLEAEFRDVMDRLRFEVKKKMLKRLSTGVAVYLVASTAALLLPLFILGAVQVAVLSLKFVVEWSFVAWLAWIFRPLEDSPYLLVGGTAEETEAMGADLGTDVGAVAQAGGPGGGGVGGGEVWGAGAAAAVAARLETEQQRQQQQQQQQHPPLPVSAGAATEARFSLAGDEDLGIGGGARAPPLPPPPPPLPPLQPLPSGGGGGGSRGGSPVSTPTRRRPSGPGTAAGGGGGPAFADVKLH